MVTRERIWEILQSKKSSSTYEQAYGVDVSGKKKRRNSFKHSRQTTSVVLAHHNISMTMTDPSQEI